MRYPFSAADFEKKVRHFPTIMARLTLFAVVFSPSIASAQVQPAKKGCDTPLIAAIHDKNVEEAGRFIKSGADLDAKACAEGETALTESIAEGVPSVAERLILAGASPNLSDNKRITPLMYAAWYCNEHIEALLLKHGALVNATDTDGFSALLHAASNCTDGVIVAMLLRSGATVNLRSRDGETALTLAVFNGDENAVRELVAAGADLTVRTGEGETALSVAKNRSVGRKPDHDRILSFLQKVTNP